jgi:signal transduction histidine kinase/response regulator RpfG family c-di-GMP phosphodiesterase
MLAADMGKAVPPPMKRTPAAGPAEMQDAFARAAQVLVVDDDERNLQAMSEVLENTAEVVCARSGEEALRALLKDEFAVIILDVLMPGLDGYETAQIIRQREQSKRTPIIFLTAINKEDAHMLRGYDAGAVDYVFKPVDPAVIRSKVSVFVDLFEKTREIRQKAALEQRLLEENLREKSERLVTEQALRKAEKHQEAILRSLPVCFHSRSAAPPFGAHFVSEAVERLTGFPPERLTKDPDFGLSRVHPDDLPQVVEALSAAQKTGSYSCEFRWRCADDTYRTFLDQGVMSGEADGPQEIFGTLLDVTERRQLEDQLMRSQRLDAVGKLTGGIAHDFNNLLAAVLGGLGLLERRVKFDEDSGQVVQMMRHAAQQGNELVKRMLAFSSRQRLKPSAVHLSNTAETIRSLVAPVLSGPIQFNWEVDDQVWPTYVDAGQLELAMMNLIFNARDAMPSGGIISVRAANRSLQVAAEDLQAGDYVAVTVTDSGAGIPPDLIARVVEPFFTTKTAGKGTGLGLSTVYGFAKQSGGTLKISSQVGRGTQMEVWLPRSANEAVTARQNEIPQQKRKRKKNEKQPAILLVDDSSSLREITAKMLRDHGLEVVSASGGAAALAALEREPQRFDLILTDFSMPLISGLEVVRFARRLRPDLPAILISGYADLNEIGDRPPDVPLISKPFADAELLNAIRETLERAHATVTMFV